MKQHLTELFLNIDTLGGEVQWLGSLNMLTALKRLEVRRNIDDPLLRSQTAVKLRVVPPQCHEMLETKLVYKLPNLVEFLWLGIQPLQEELVLASPKLTYVLFRESISMRVTVEDAALEEVNFIQCEEIQFTLESPQEQLKNLWSLEVEDCSEIGRHLIEDIHLMRNLENLCYEGFPATCMPTSFPKGLQCIQLAPFDWSQDLPGGLKELHNLKTFSFVSKSEESWDNNTLSNIKRPFADLLPIDSLDCLHLGYNSYKRQPDGTLQLPEYR